MKKSIFEYSSYYFWLEDTVEQLLCKFYRAHPTVLNIKHFLEQVAILILNGCEF